jgi:hypothetical protein
MLRKLLLGAVLALAIGQAPALAVCDPNLPGQNTAQYQQLKTICENQGSTPVQEGGTVTLGAGSANVGNVGGKTVTVCFAPTVTNNTYAANQLVGGLLTFANLFTSKGSGILQSVTVNFKTAQTVGFVFFPFSANPSNSTWTDRSAGAINAADVFKARPPISLASPKSNLGTHTVYSATGLGQPWVTGSTSGWGVLVPEATTASLGGTADVVEICTTTLQDL